jgi:hypothetical protein
MLSCIQLLLTEEAMTNTFKQNLIKSLNNFEKNFQPLLESKEIKKIVKVLKDNRVKRAKQAEEMLTQPIREGLANYNREKKALKALYKKETKKMKQAFDEQLNLMEDIKKTLEKHSISKKSKAKTKKKIAKKTTKSSVSKSSKKTTKKVAIKATKKATKKVQRKV